MVRWFFFLLGFSVFAAHGPQEVIYGEDDREDIPETNSYISRIAESVAAMVDWSKLEKKDGYYALSVKKFSTLVCEEERFSDQNIASRCTGFLVKPDTLVTAGHCMMSEGSCDKFAWVFGLHSDLPMEDGKVILQESQVIGCSKIIAKKFGYRSKLDYSILKLDRPADRPVLTFRKEGNVGKEDSLMVIGHPSGLPMKVALNSKVRDTDHEDFFSMSSDTYGGNSGSPVLNQNTGIVEGILVRGEKDYIYDAEKKCRRSNHCAEDGCRGEDVIRITRLSEL